MKWLLEEYPPNCHKPWFSKIRGWHYWLFAVLDSGTSLLIYVWFASEWWLIAIRGFCCLVYRNISGEWDMHEKQHIWYGCFPRIHSVYGHLMTDVFSFLAMQCHNLALCNSLWTSIPLEWHIYIYTQYTYTHIYTHVHAYTYMCTYSCLVQMQRHAIPGWTTRRAGSSEVRAQYFRGP